MAPRHRLPVYLDGALYERIRQLAFEQRVTMSALVCRAIEQGLGAQTELPRVERALETRTAIREHRETPPEPPRSPLLPPTGKHSFTPDFKKGSR